MITRLRPTPAPLKTCVWSAQSMPIQAAIAGVEISILDMADPSLSEFKATHEQGVFIILIAESSRDMI